MKKYLMAAGILISGLAVFSFFSGASPALAITLGPNNPGTGANQSLSPCIGSQISWSTPGNVTSSDGQYATTTGTGASTRTSGCLEAYNFGFSIPAGSIVNGIQVAVSRRSLLSTGTSVVNDKVVRLIKADHTYGATNEAATGTNWPSAVATAMYGSSSDLWGDVWGSADINDVDFGATVQTFITNGTGIGTGSVDSITITVFYTTGASPDAQSSTVIFE